VKQRGTLGQIKSGIACSQTARVTSGRAESENRTTAEIEIENNRDDDNINSCCLIVRCGTERVSAHDRALVSMPIPANNHVVGKERDFRCRERRQLSLPARIQNLHCVVIVDWLQ
jgi:hypothetical protein